MRAYIEAKDNDQVGKKFLSKAGAAELSAHRSHVAFSYEPTVRELFALANWYDMELAKKLLVENAEEIQRLYSGRVIPEYSQAGLELIKKWKNAKLAREAQKGALRDSKE